MIPTRPLSRQSGAEAAPRFTQELAASVKAAQLDRACKPKGVSSIDTLAASREQQ